MIQVLEEWTEDKFVRCNVFSKCMMVVVSPLSVQPSELKYFKQEFTERTKGFCVPIQMEMHLFE